MLKRVITGFNPRGDGFLIITSRSLQEVAASDFHLEVVDVGADQFFAPGRFSDDELQMIADGDTPRNSYRVYVADYAEDKNLAAAVCW